MFIFYLKKNSIQYLRTLVIDSSCPITPKIFFPKQILFLFGNLFLEFQVQNSEFYVVYYIKNLMNSRTAPFPNYYYHYFPFNQPRMEYYPYQAPYFQTYMGCPPKKDEQSVQNCLKNGQIEKQRNTTESKSKKLPEKKANPLKSPRTKSQKKEKDQEYQERKQTPQRNTLSNTIKFFLRYAILKPQLAQPEVKKILENLNCKYDSEDFLRAFENQFSGKMNYISKNNIERIWLGELSSFSSICENQKVEFCLVFRELFHIYFERIIYEERFSGKQKKRKFELDSKKRIKNFIKQLQNKLKRKNEAPRTEN